MTKQTLRLPTGEEIAYWTHHDDKKQTLVLVHGFTGSHEGFQYLVPLLTDFRMIIPDLPGFGVSPLPHQKLTLAGLGELLVDFVDTLKLDKAPYLLGHSMGSLVVAEAASQHPQSFAKKLILSSPVPRPVGMLEPRRLGVLFSELYYLASHRLPGGHRIATSRLISRVATTLIMTTRNKPMRKKIYGHHYGNLDHISDIGWNKRLYREINRTGMNRYKAALSRFDVLVTNGDRDNVTPLAMQRKIAADIGAKLVIIPGTGHLSHYEKPEELARAYADFLR